MKIPKEFEDVFRGVELTEDEIRTLNWIVGWDAHTVNSLRSAIRKAQASALSTLQGENEKLRAESIMHHNAADNYFAELTEYRQERNEALAELEQVKRERDDLIEDFVDYVTGGVPNPAIFCKNRCDKCTDMRGWCTGKDCKGFYPSGASGQKED